jgi:hypothetical protein
MGHYFYGGGVTELKDQFAYEGRNVMPAFKIFGQRLVEMRFLPVIWAIYTSDPLKIEEALAHPLTAGLNAYILLNELKPDTPERKGVQRNVLFRAGRNQLSSDVDILRRRYILLDSDVAKAAGTAATEEQSAAAHAHSAKIEAALTAEGWSLPAACYSGNGVHRLYAVDLPNDQETDRLLSNLLKVLAQRFDEEVVKLDKSVHNAGRITRLYGSHNYKAGRDSAVLSIPEPLVPVTREQIEALVTKWCPRPQGVKVRTERPGEWTPELIEALLDFHFVDYWPPVQKADGLFWYVTCPFNPEHTGSSVAVWLTKTGWPRFRCMHASCQTRKWKDFLGTLNILNGKVFRWTTKPFANKSQTS